MRFTAKLCGTDWWSSPTVVQSNEGHAHYISLHQHPGKWYASFAQIGLQRSACCSCAASDYCPDILSYADGLASLLCDPIMMPDT
eukprot:471364-Pelagomonas_calceolata.AAC.1